MPSPADTRCERPVVGTVLVVAEDDRLKDRLDGLCEGPPRFVPAGDRAVSIAVATRPDTLLIDGAATGLDVARLTELCQSAPQASRILLLPSCTGRWISAADRCGADVVLAAPMEPADLLRACAGGSRRASESEALAVLPDLVDESPRMADVWRLVSLASRSDASVVVEGATGAGKEVVARALHRFSHRRNGPFVAINCAALPETLLESELFGHEKGSFTGATALRKGRFELAEGGTLFLDEVGELSLALQVKLLRVLQERSFERVGGTQTLSADVRIVSATHRDLAEDMARGRFREDLYYRLRVLAISVPPLAQRKDDILPLWNHFVGMVAEREGRAPPVTSMAAQRRLLRHGWPGNVRELFNAAQYACMVARAGTISPTDLPPTAAAADGAGPTGSLVGMTLREVERTAILETYSAFGTVKATAEALAVSERKLHYRLKEYRTEGGVAPRSGRSTGTGTGDPSDSTYILIAEDDDEVRWGLHDLLKCAGYRVVPVADGRSLLEHLGAKMLFEADSSLPSLIITDVRMPFFTGVELLERVRERAWETPVVVVSGFADDDLKRRVASLGAAAFLEKPLDDVALLNIVKSLVSPDA